MVYVVVVAVLAVALVVELLVVVVEQFKLHGQVHLQRPNHHWVLVEALHQWLVEPVDVLHHLVVLGLKVSLVHALVHFLLLFLFRWLLRRRSKRPRVNKGLGTSQLQVGHGIVGHRVRSQKLIFTAKAIFKRSQSSAPHIATSRSEAHSLQLPHLHLPVGEDSAAQHQSPLRVQTTCIDS